ncbi:MAG TPA: prepilin-type N-terminal cleavage/methylation domain-containing protein [Terriglobales bacterium]|nr:prepilin-type N-terminal cleavage/methylation domain-containing protein [Terriglobales bacterium]
MTLNNRKEKGFSLIELLIVVAIILIIAAMAIPSLLKARISADEASAVASIRAINQAEISYQTSFPSVGFAANLSNLGGAPPCTPSPATSCLLDNSLAMASPGNGSKSGYVFQATGQNPINGVNTQYTAGASPLSYNSTGIRNFCSNEDGVIRFNAGSAGSTPVNNAAACLNFTAMQ